MSVSIELPAVDVVCEQLEDAASYEERALLRKVLRDVKKGVIEPHEALRITSNGGGSDTKVRRTPVSSLHLLNRFSLQVVHGHTFRMCRVAI